MKIVVIGCTHAGTSAIINAANLYPDAQITVYERNDNISFLSCGIALYIEGIVKDVKGLFYSSPEHLGSLGVKMKMKHDVIDIDFGKKTLKAKDLDSGNIVEDSFDKMIITAGSWPISPNIEGKDIENIVVCKNYNHAKALIEKTPNAKKIAVMGAGYIGVELVEAFAENGKEVTVIDMEARVMDKYFDKEFTDIAEKELKGHGIKLALGEKVLKFSGENGKVSKVVTDKGEHEVDLVVMCVGFAPNTALFKGKLEMTAGGAIIVDEYMSTSQEDVVAAGDCAVVRYNPTEEIRYIPLATNAVRQGNLAARNLVKPTIKDIGTQGTSGIKIYEAQMAAVGLTENEAKKHFKNVKTASVNSSFRPAFMPTHETVMLKYVYDGDTRILLGAQLVSKEDYTQTINTLSICIYKKMTIEEVAFVDQFFQPHFNTPWNIINTVALGEL